MEPAGGISSSKPSSATHIRIAASIIAVVILLSCSYFFTGGGWNQASHFDLVRALVEEGRIQIDSFHENTGDKSQRDGHFYCNKAPGTAFLATPFVAMTHAIAIAGGGDPKGERVLLGEARMATLVVSTLPTVIAALCLFFLSLRFGLSVPASAVAAVGFGLGTPAWAYGTIFWSHPLATGCLMVAFVLALKSEESGSPSRDIRIAIGVGLTAGWAAITEYQSFGAILMVVGLLLWHGFRDGRQRGIRLAGSLVLGGILPALLLGAYNHAAFGSPFQLSYAASANFTEGHGEGLLGVTHPKPEILLRLLLGTEKGVLLLAPLLIVAPWGLTVLARQPRHRIPALVAGAIFTYYLLFNSAYHFWWGGWGYGPRFLAPGVAFLCIGLAPAWQAAGRRLRQGILALMVLSVLQALVALSTHAMPPDTYGFPIVQLSWPSFVRGRMSQIQDPLFAAGTPTPSFNAGEWAGLRGLESLFPLIGLWLLLDMAWVGNQRRSKAVPTPALPPEPPPPLPIATARLMDRVLPRLDALPPWACLAVAGALFVLLALPGLTGDSSTYDEVVYVPTGYTHAVLGDLRMTPEHPPLSKTFNGLGLLALDVAAPEEDITWYQRDQWAYGFRQLYQNGNDATSMLTAARLMSLFWGLLLVFSIYAVARERFGNVGGLLGLVLAVACPTLIAHSHYATMDVTLAALCFLSVVTFRRWMEYPTTLRAEQAGVLLAGALLTKHSALVLLVVLPMILVLDFFRHRSSPPREGGRRRGWRTALSLVYLGGIAFGLIWAGHQFRFLASTAEVPLPWDHLALRKTLLAEAIQFARRFEFLPEAYLWGIAQTQYHSEGGHAAYALGLHSSKGWWWYFPVAFLIKSPVTAVALIGWGVWAGFRAGRAALFNHAAWLAFPVVFGAAAMTSGIHIGLRQVLPVLPFLLLAAGGVLAWCLRSEKPVSRRNLALTLTTVAFLECLLGAPHYVAYMNAPSLLYSERHELLGDSNLDWGQDLSRLKAFMERNRIDEIKLAYFGTASPRHLNLKHRVLKGYALYPLYEREWEKADVVRPGELVAISANCFIGLYLDDRAMYRSMVNGAKPLAKIGQSIYVYRVPPNYSPPE